MTPLKSLTLRKEDEAFIKDHLDYYEDLNFFIFYDNKNEASVSYVSQIEKFWDRMGIKNRITKVPYCPKAAAIKILEEIAATEAEEQDLLENENIEEEDLSRFAVLFVNPIPKKYVDDFTPYVESNANDPDFAGMWERGCFYSGDDDYLPATPRSVLKLITSAGVDLTGKKALVIGRSKAVGLPVALGLLHKNMQVTLVHSKITPEDIKKAASQSDVIVLASGVRGLVDKDSLKPGQIIIDCGYHSDGMGDLGFVPDEKMPGFYTPGVGGVGPLTVAELLVNCWLIHADTDQED